MNNFVVISYEEFSKREKGLTKQYEWLLINHGGNLGYNLYHFHSNSGPENSWGGTGREALQCKACEKKVPECVKITYLLLRS